MMEASNTVCITLLTFKCFNLLQTEKHYLDHN